MTGLEITAIIVGLTIILGFPISYQIFGKEDQCGRTVWDKIKRKFGW